MKKILIYSIMLILLSSFAYSLDISNDVISCWNFDNDSVSGNYILDNASNNKMTANGDPSQVDSRVPELGNAVNLDGNDYYNITNAVGFDGLKEIAVCAWIRHPDADVDTLISHNDHPGASKQFAVESVTGAHRIYLSTTGNTDHYTPGKDDGSGSWLYSCYTYDGTNLTLYVNGTWIAASAAFSGSISNSTQPLFIGAQLSNDVPGYMWNGDIDELVVVNKSLNQSQIQEMYQNMTCAEILAPPSIVTPSIDLIFRNESDQVTTNFDEGEEFIVQVNYTLSNGTIFDNETGNCTITLINGFSEIDGDDDNFTLCNSGCDFLNKSQAFETETTVNAINDTVHFNACHEQNSNGDISIKISCAGIGSESFAIAPSQIPLCSAGEAFIRVGTDVCASSLNVNISVTADIPNSQRKQITELGADRQYNKHINSYSTDVEWNSTANLWQTRHLHEYYTEGAKTITANCTESTNEFNVNASETITIVNVPPAISFSQVISPEGIIYDLTEGVEMEYENGTWNFTGAIIDDDPDVLNVTWYCANGTSLQSFQGDPFTTSLIIDSALLVDFDCNPFNLSVWVNDSSNEFANESITFLINDTQDPVCGFPASYELEEGDNLNFNIECTDENFFMLNVTCPSNNFTFFVDGLNVQSYLFNQSISNPEGDSCSYEYCDGHTAEELEKDWNIIVINQTFEFYTNYEMKAKLWIDNKDALLSFEQKHDRIEYTIRLSKSDVSPYQTIYYQASKNSYYFPDDKYRGWVVDAPSRLWNDLNNVAGDLQVFKHKDGLWEFRIYTDSKLLEFKSIGELNCVSGSFTIDVMLNPSRTNQFESIEEGIFWMFLIMLWVVFVILLFTVKGANGQTVGLFNMFQVTLGVVLGIGFLKFSVIIGFLIVVSAAILFVGKAMELQGD